MSKIRYVYYDGNNENDFTEIKNMWKYIFEEAEGFWNYYFEQVSPKTKIIVAKDENKIIGMVHLNPYDVYVKGNVVRAYYVIGVAVIEAYRRKGVMTAMMNKVIQDEKENNTPFLFLMPEKKQYYESLGFKPVMNTLSVDLKINSIGNENQDLGKLNSSELNIVDSLESLQHNVVNKLSKISNLKNMNYDEMRNLSNEINNGLAKKCDYFCIRDISYLENMIKEHDCQDGEVFILEGQNGLAVITLDVHEGKLYIERFANIGLGFAYIINVLINYMKHRKMWCCNVTVPVYSENAAEDISTILRTMQVEYGDIQSFKIEGGKGIMALALQDNFSIDDMVKKCLFDEIV